MKKKYFIVILSILAFMPIIPVNAINIDSKHVTYSNNKTLNDNVEDSINELQNKINEMTLGGTATAEDVDEGSTIMIDGKEVAGTRKPDGVYFTLQSESEAFAYINDELVSYESNYSGDYLVHIINWNNQNITFATDNSKNEYRFERFYQFSDTVIGVLYSRSSLIKDTDTVTEYRVYNYLSTYKFDGTTLKAVTSALSIGGFRGNADNVAYYTDRYEYSDTYTEYRYDFNISPSAIYYSSNNLLNYNVWSDCQKTNYNEQEIHNYWYSCLQINTRTGTATNGKYYNFSTTKNGDNYSSVYDYNSTYYGVIRYTYTDLSHDTVSSYTYYDLYDNTGLASGYITSTSQYDNNYVARDILNDVYYEKNVYGIEYNITTDLKSVIINLKSARFGNDTVNANYFVTPIIYDKETIIDFSSILPGNVTISNDSKSLISFYDINNGKLYMICNCNIGKVYIIVSFSESIETGELIATPNSITYRKTENGQYTKTLYLENNKSVRFYR